MGTSMRTSPRARSGELIGRGGQPDDHGHLPADPHHDVQVDGARRPGAAGDREPRVAGLVARQSGGELQQGVVVEPRRRPPGEAGHVGGEIAGRVAVPVGVPQHEGVASLVHGAEPREWRPRTAAAAVPEDGGCWRGEGTGYWS
ncbi:hypothetical protein FHX36_001364 [Modestobacter versicolor]|uniref:Uncharacterized protein n=1 Tax=Modestobacter versicolor TaxID=429133 RepID=A0A839XYI7_9ACTN|nr:hypothetical protein [Modestobacter versicolor]MBB3675629.1 hypothetical protein [Modestobacter versicolor]